MTISVKEVKSLPIKGFKVPFEHPTTPQGTLIEGMGGGRFRIHTPRKTRVKG